MTDTTFAAFGLAEPLERALDARDHTVPTPIQVQAIPELMAGRDVLGVAQTGTGKTAAFALPLLHRLTEHPAGRDRRPRGLILAPTRELAIQIGAEFAAYGKHVPVRHTVIFGGVGQNPQTQALARGVDIIIATPGRLLDLMGQGRVPLDRIEYLVLDEADRMLDMGFVRDVRRILSALPKRRQSLLFSATMPKEIAGLAEEILHQPVRIAVTPQATPVELIEQRVHHVESGAKTALLAAVLDDPALSRVIVFARTKHRANRVAEQLGKRGVAVEAIHGNKSQNARQRALARFRSGDARVLVATDIAARGIDVPAVSHVFNFELPNEAESYVHRIGRTARAGAAGAAVSFCDPSERAYLRDIERLTGQRLAVVGDEPAGPLPVPEGKTKSRGGKPRRRGGGRRADTGRGARAA
ncbi:MAG TPA: DEAD/DEAH box helicase [Thermohalobaculum sp.]|nr:DEAD/DEAH box helicase [Thermohalobaculum sp.]